MKEIEDHLLFVDDAVAIARGEECLQRMVNEVGIVYGRRKPQVDVNKFKVMKVSKYGVPIICVVRTDARHRCFVAVFAWASVL